ncbi:YjjG family noncanonical pyrimidine nucleotidase [Streptococcus moroccensis]|nr:YjjG family noncanonical pyrimidine nucleotidase [Streptococcus moroccensis]
MPYKYLLFDLDHTLLDFDAAEDAALDALFAEQEVEDIQALKAYYIPMNQGMWRALERGEITKQELVSTRFAKAFAHIGRELDGVYLADRYQYFLSQQGQTYPGVHELLDTLKDRGYKLYAATNGISGIQRGRLAQSGLLERFDALFISEEMGTAKPLAAYFEKIAEQIDEFQPDQTVMIGDSLTADIPGGIDAGLTTIWVNFNQLENTSQWQPDYTVTDLEQLLTILD